ncbi:MAG: hypothetical protein ABWZ25_18995 [Chitinophagaceae bacterium]
MAMLNGREFGSWDNYFREKFPEDKLIVDRDTEPGLFTINVRSRDLECETRLTIEFPGQDTCMVTCRNPDSSLSGIGLNGDLLNDAMFETYYEFNDISLDQLDNQLNIPLYFGWTEELDLYHEKIIQAELLVHDTKGMHRIPVEKNRTWLDKAGCLLMFFTWPVLYIQHQVVLILYRTGIRKYRKHQVDVPPMISLRATDRPVT